MSQYAAAQLDLSRLPAFRLLQFDFETEAKALIDGVTARLAQAGVDYNVGMIKGDPFVKLCEEFAYRKILTAGQINDAGKQLSLQYGFGEALDHLAATQFPDANIVRLVTGTDANGDPIYESDDRFRARISLAPQARTAGTLGSYEFWALTLAPEIESVRALNYASGLVSPGQIRVSVYGGPDEAASVETLQDAFRDRIFDTAALLTDRSVHFAKLGTDDVIVVAAPRTHTSIVAVLEVRRGPDPAVVRTEAMSRLDEYLAVTKSVGASLAWTGIVAALTVGGVVRVKVTTPTEDINPSPDGIVEVDSITVTTTVVGG